MSRSARAVGAVVAVLAAGVGAGAAPASAHVEVSPALAAPSDPVLFTVLVPNERGDPTVRVELAMPPGVLPFGFEPAPGWKRTEARNPDQSLGRVAWTGRLGAGEFTEFRFLATTPPDPGPIRWVALQRYANGEVVRWDGPPGADEPAAVTIVARGVPRQNAGGEGSAGDSASGPAPTDVMPPGAETMPAGSMAAMAPSGEAPPAAATTAVASGEDDLARTAGIAGLALGAMGLIAGLAALIVVARARIAADATRGPGA